MSLTIDESKELLELLELTERLKVSPKLEVFRNPCRIKGCRGGRGAGAKSWSCTSLICQRAHREKLRIACLREIQKTLEESAHHLFEQTIERIGYQGWKITNEYIDSPAGAHIIFRGLKDYRTVLGAKGLEGFDIFFVEEASALSLESWEILLPTLFRNKGAELWFCYNQEEDPDPVTEKIWNREWDDAMLVELEPGPKDNPWWSEGLQVLMDSDFKYDPDLAEHVWLGQPRKQGVYSIMSRTSIRGAMSRNIRDPIGGLELGVDVARFGDDKTVIYKRKGMKIIGYKEWKGQDTMRTAKEAWDMAERKPFVPIKVDDTGVGGGVSDRLREFGANVVRINFNGTPREINKYSTVADEMWFNFPVDDADIPDDTELMRQLSSRRYDYDPKNRKKIESKSKYKERCGKSPDNADALLLCYYVGGNIIMSDRVRNQLAQRRNNR